MASSDDESRERIRALREDRVERELQDYSSDSDRPSEITIANVGTVKVRIPRHQHRAIGWSVVLVLVACSCYVFVRAWAAVR